MAGLLLTEEESHRFVSWLIRHAESNKGLIEQFKTLPPAVAQAMTQKFETEIKACLIVARILSSAESVSIDSV